MLDEKDKELNELPVKRELKIAQIGLGRTVNLGNYESARFDVQVLVDPEEPFHDQVKSALNELLDQMKQWFKQDRRPGRQIEVLEKETEAILKRILPETDQEKMLRRELVRGQLHSIDQMIANISEIVTWQVNNFLDKLFVQRELISVELKTLGDEPRLRRVRFRYEEIEIEKPADSDPESYDDSEHV